MDRRHRTLLLPLSATHPGETVREYLDFHGWSRRELARRTDLTPKTISEICSGKAPISPNTALALERVFRRPAHFWLNLQRHYNEVMARRQESINAVDWSKWAETFPLKEMRRLNFSLPQGRSDADTLLAFFAVSSPASWRSVWTSTSVAYRQTRRFQTSEESIAAWIRETELVASTLEVAPFDERRLLASIAPLRRLTRRGVDEALDLIQQQCASAGLAVVMVPALPQTGISGCARWLGDGRALIGLTLRYKTDDQLWFTFFHELAHVLLHRRKRKFVVDNAATDFGDRIVDPEMRALESEANHFAADTLIPPQSLTDFLRRDTFTNESIHDFAEYVGVGPSIVVGRLQYEGILEKHQGNALKQRLSWHLKEDG